MNTPSLAECGACALWAMGCGCCLRAVLLQHRVEHLGDGALLGGGKLADLFELLLDLRRRPAFAAASPGRRGDRWDTHNYN
jgi:hypothetical protein